MQHGGWWEGMATPAWALSADGVRIAAANAAARALPGAPIAGDAAARLEDFLGQNCDWLRHDLPGGTGSPPMVLALDGQPHLAQHAICAAGPVIFDWDIAHDTIRWRHHSGLAYGHDCAHFPRDLAEWLEHVHPDDQARVTALTAAPPVVGEIWEAEYRFRSAKGDYVTVLDRGEVLAGVDGQPARMIGVMLDVTATRAAEDRFAEATAATSDTIYIIDFDTGQQWWSTGLARFGLAPCQGPPNFAHWLSLIHPEDAERVRASHAEAEASDAQTWTCEYRLHRADGSFASVIHRAHFHRDADRRIRRSVGSVVDVTALRTGEARMREAFAAAQDVFYIWDIAKGEVWDSGNLARVLGVTEGEDKHATWKDHLHPKDRDQHLAARDAFLAGDGTQWEFAYRIVTETGKVRHIIDRAQVSRDAAGVAVRVAGSMVDVTRLRREQERLATILHVASDVFYEMDLASNTITFSEGALRVFGQDWAGRHGQPSPWAEAVHPDDLKPMMRAFRAFIAGRKREWTTAYRLRRGDGSWAHVREKSVALRDDTGNATRIIGTISDATAEVEAADRLRQAERLEALGKLTGGVAHDFNNLLTVILGNAEALSEAATTPDKIEMARAIMDASRRGAELVGNLLSFARRQPMRPALLEAGAVMAELKRLIDRTLPAWIGLEVMAEDQLVPIEVDPAQLQTALLNLVVNAVDAMPDGGKLLIEARAVELDSAYAARQPQARPGRYLRLAISDTGEGMPADIAAQAFDPFFTTKPVGKGSGLGLSMVHGFAIQSGGHVNIYSEPSQGTTVSLYLPEARAGAASGRFGSATEGPVPMGRGEVIVVAEDDAALRAHVGRLIESLGYRAVLAEDGAAALAAVRAAGGTVALLFTDVVMPGALSGRALAEAARAEYPGLRVLFTSGYTENSIVHQGRLDADVQLLSKPYMRADLARKLAEVLAG